MYSFSDNKRFGLTEKDVDEELATVKHESKQLAVRLESLSDDERAVQLMHLFMFDIIGKETREGRMLTAKLNQE